MPKRALALLVAASCGQAPPQRGSALATPRAPVAARPQTPVTTSPVGPPVARIADVVETHFEVAVHDPYRWMEADADGERTSWMKAQGAYARRWLDAVPGRDALFQRLREVGLGTGTVGGYQLAGPRAFYERTARGAQLPVLIVRDATGERVLLDPAKLGRGGQHASLNAYSASSDGAMVAYDLSLGGGEVSSIHVMDVTTGKELPDVVEHVWGEFSASWLPGGKAFLYTQMAPPADGVDPMLDMQVRLHVLGTPVDQDVPILGHGVGSMPIRPEEFPVVEIPPGSGWMIARAGGAHVGAPVAIAPVAKLDRTGAGKTPWRAVATLADEIVEAAIHGDRLYLSSFHDASNRKIISVALSAPDLSRARVEVAERPDVLLRDFATARDALYVVEMIDGRSHLLRAPWKGKPVEVPLPYEGAITGMAFEPQRDGLVFAIEGWTHPGAYFAVDRTGAVTPVGVGTESTADFSNVAVDEVSALSVDGTEVPLTILRAKEATADGSHPALLHGYGGYGSVMSPSFNPLLLPWLERGGVYAVCHVRGGGEKGERWHRDGARDRKMNAVHDFEACGQALVDRKLTTRGRLFGRAVSMGGVLLGRAITDRPELFAGVNIAVGMLNPIRLMAQENGANQKVEVGDPESESGWKGLLEMDTYHHVAAGTAYPAVIFTVGLNDHRVAPWETSKTAAKLQVATTSSKPVLVRIDEDGGHGVGSTRDQIYAERADVYAFFLAIAGVPGFERR